jgi:hypothetical protein
VNGNAFTRTAELLKVSGHDRAQSKDSIDVRKDRSVGRAPLFQASELIYISSIETDDPGNTERLG